MSIHKIKKIQPVVVCLEYFIPDLPPLLYRIKWDCQEKYLFFFNYFFLTMGLSHDIICH